MGGKPFGNRTPLRFGNAMKAGGISRALLPGILLICLACETQTAGPVEEPVDLVVDLVIDEVWTMDELAKALTEKTGVPFVLSPGIDPHRRMQDPYMIMSFEQNLKEHLDELEAWGLWSFTWQDGKYVIGEL
jgi:hypothetical protein